MYKDLITSHLQISLLSTSVIFTGTFPTLHNPVYWTVTLVFLSGTMPKANKTLLCGFAISQQRPHFVVLSFVIHSAKPKKRNYTRISFNANFSTEAGKKNTKQYCNSENYSKTRVNSLQQQLNYFLVHPLLIFSKKLQYFILHHSIITNIHEKVMQELSDN